MIRSYISFSVISAFISFMFFVSFFFFPFLSFLGIEMIEQVIDGERGSEHRRKLLPSYKAHRRKFTRHISSLQRFSSGHVGRSLQVINDVLGKCNVPVSCSVSLLLFHFPSNFLAKFHFFFSFYPEHKR